MRLLRLAVCGTALATLAVALAGIDRPLAAQNAADSGENNPGIDVQTHGPIHEAFGQPVVYDPTPAMVVAQKPPDPIEELPPDQKPDGDDVVWIPGYWGWDDTNQTFLWVSGFWRHLPPGRQWVPGYWTQVTNGYQWIAGYWATAGQTEMNYLPEPPASLEAGPSTEAPGDTYLWSPGCWIWGETRYAWRPGYWVADQPGWVWTPPMYNWTPRGCVFLDGFWDFSPRRRGLLFAPCAFRPGVIAQPGFAFTPDVALNINNVVDSLFCWPRYRHYCFGDYYATNFLQRGIYPWFAYHQSRHGYEPMFAYYENYYQRRDPKWGQWQREEYFQRRDRPEDRPPRTFVAQRAFIQNIVNQRKDVNVEHYELAQPLTEVVKTAGSERGASLNRFVAIDRAQRNTLVQQARSVQKFVHEREKLEIAKREDGPGQQAQPIRTKMPESPLAARTPRGQERPEAVAPALPKAPGAQPGVKTPPNPAARQRPEERLDQLQKHPATPPRPEERRPAVTPKGDEPKPAPPKVEDKRPTPVPLPKPDEPKPAPPKVEDKRPTPVPLPKPDEPKPAPPKVEDKRPTPVPLPKPDEPKPAPPKVEDKRPTPVPLPLRPEVAPRAEPPRARPAFPPRDEGVRPPAQPPAAQPKAPQPPAAEPKNVAPQPPKPQPAPPKAQPAPQPPKPQPPPEKPNEKK